MRTFVIGDVHGHWDRLEALLDKAGPSADDEIIQLGDLGHFSQDTRIDDYTTLKYAAGLPNFTMLWGNHDRAVVDEARHRFAGFHPPMVMTYERLISLKPKLCAVRHGHLITHAGLHPDYSNPTAAIGDYERIIQTRGLGLTVNAISTRRGGPDAAGGILWRDWGEPLANVPQIFGHTRSESVRIHHQPDQGRSFCIDIASATNSRLAGIWLPSLQIITVGD